MNQSEFNVRLHPQINLVVEKYCEYGPDYDLITFIRLIINTFNNGLTGTNDTTPMIFLRFIDTLYIDISYIEKFIFNLELAYYKRYSISKRYTLNNELKLWCDKFDNLRKNVKLNGILRNVIIPYQTNFLKKLYNPRTEIGHNFAITNMNKLDWEDSEHEPNITYSRISKDVNNIIFNNVYSTSLEDTVPLWMKYNL